MASSGDRDLVSEMRLMHLVSSMLEKIAQGKDEPEILSAVNALNDRFRSCENILDTLPSGDLTRAEQLDLLKSLHDRLHRTREMVQNYQSLEVFKIVEDDPANNTVPMDT
eukprot:CAMPEP_0184746196 /NCGR_PEP_ID=MMETSP0315-20130426/8738_1 /TAXON_ID=101924 /ORGANISM="Rhodosorus marinus, Strain UTEX LB 2760" /LENGTH=109 /DNA_ID=CAMNT_0027218621 /DNA_START=25 /DNA_END=357 /DNA_ORIENTATION=+